MASSKKMLTWIALFRAINVGGKNVLPMKELTDVLAQLGLSDIRTYIQSGNVLFRSSLKDREALATKIREAIQLSHGFKPVTILLNAAELAQAIAANPFATAAAEPKSVHLYFLAQPPAPDLVALNALKASDEAFAIVGRVFYLHTPQGIGRSKLATGAEKHLGVEVTARNWRTANRILELAQELA